MALAVQPNMTRGGERGFTLIEVLVALTILSISLAVLMGVFGTSLARSREAQSQLEARRLASSLLATAENADDLQIGETTGRGSSGYVWHLQVQPYGSAEDNQAWIAHAAEIRATVSWDDGSSGHTVSLATLRLLPKGTLP